MLAMAMVLLVLVWHLTLYRFTVGARPWHDTVQKAEFHLTVLLPVQLKVMIALIYRKQLLSSSVQVLPPYQVNTKAVGRRLFYFSLRQEIAVREKCRVKLQYWYKILLSASGPTH